MKKIAGYTTTEWKVAGVVFLVLLTALVGWAAWTHETPVQKQARLQAERDVEDKREAEKLAKQMIFDPSKAFGMCHDAIRLVSRDAQNSVIPFMFPIGGDKKNRFVFAWTPQTKMLRMRNGLGNEVPATAHCIVNPQTKNIDLLIVDDKVIVAERA